MVRIVKKMGRAARKASRAGDIGSVLKRQSKVECQKSGKRTRKIKKNVYAKKLLTLIFY